MIGKVVKGRFKLTFLGGPNYTVNFGISEEGLISVTVQAMAINNINLHLSTDVKGHNCSITLSTTN